MIVPRGCARKLHLSIANESFRTFLTELLHEWHFVVTTDPPATGDDLLLTDENALTATEHPNSIRLTYSGFGGRDRLSIPLTLEDLWTALETRFHRPPRNQLRIPVEYPVSVHLRGEKSPAQLVSLSPVGARLPLHRELAFGEEFPLILPLQDHVLHLQARVIYVTPLAETSGRYETGVIFERLDPLTKQVLRDYIVIEFLSRIRSRLPGWAFEVGLSYLKLPTSVTNRL